MQRHANRDGQVVQAGDIPAQRGPGKPDQREQPRPECPRQRARVRADRVHQIVQRAVRADQYWDGQLGATVLQVSQPGQPVAAERVGG